MYILVKFEYPVHVELQCHEPSHQWVKRKDHGAFSLQALPRPSVSSGQDSRRASPSAEVGASYGWESGIWIEPQINWTQAFSDDS